jgi:hypothetical protein
MVEPIPNTPPAASEQARRRAPHSSRPPPPPASIGVALRGDGYRLSDRLSYAFTQA